MGNAALSKVYNTELQEKANLKVNKDGEGANIEIPVSEYTIYEFKKLCTKSNNRREYKVHLGGVCCYTTRKVNGTDVWFDVLDGSRPVMRVKAKSQRRIDWDVYAFNTPAFNGQHRDDEACRRVSGDVLYRKWRLSVSLVNNWVDVFRYVDSQIDPAGVPSKTPSLVIKTPILAAKDSKLSFETFIPGEKQEKIGFWEWGDDENSVQMHLKEGADPAIHAIVLVVTNIARHETLSAAAAAGSAAY